MYVENVTFDFPFFLISRTEKESTVPDRYFIIIPEDLLHTHCPDTSERVRKYLQLMFYSRSLTSPCPYTHYDITVAAVLRTFQVNVF